MKTTRRLLAIFLLSMQTLAAAADDAGEIDTSKWNCKYCEFEEEGFSGTLELGLGYVSDDSYKFGEYNGLNEQGLYFIGDADLRVRDEDAKYWNIIVTNAGLDTRSISVEGGKQGSYKLNFSYDELPHYISDSGRTPFLGSGTDSLTLPGSPWTPGNDTSQMPDLANSLHDETLETSRKRLGLGATLIASSSWQYAVNFRHETREGKQKISGSFLFNSAQMVLPVDYVTQQIDVSASYAKRDLQARFAYYGSLFSESNNALNWENPYISGSGATNGQLALPPDNEFHQLVAAVGYNLGKNTRATADIAFGRMTQNQEFLDTTTNNSLTGYPFALPRNSLDGLIDTLDANVKISTTLTPDLRMSLAYVYNDHDDKTPQADYTWVTTDEVVNTTTRTNLPYSYTQSKIKLDADYQVTAHTKISAGIDNETDERTYQEVSKSTEDTYWAKAKTRAPGNVQITLKLAHATRDIGSYEALPWLDTAENPLLRKYNMADRDRDEGTLRIELLGLDNFNIGFGINYAKDDYSQSVIGLTDSKDVTYSADATYVLSKQTSLYGFLNHEEIDSRQVGSSSGTTPDWTGQNNDTIDTFGIGVKHTLIEDTLDIGADYNISKSRGEVQVYTGSNEPPFPDNTVDLQSIKLYATYKLQDNLSVKGTYWYESFDSTDWRLDGVTADTIPNVLSLGEQSPSYDVNVVMVSLRYKF